MIPIKYQSGMCLNHERILKLKFVTENSNAMLRNKTVSRQEKGAKETVLKIQQI